jgi:hypothetical protein
VNTDVSAERTPYTRKKILFSYPKTIGCRSTETLFRQNELVGQAILFLGRVPKLPINVEEILSRAPGKFEEQNKVLKSSINYY